MLSGLLARFNEIHDGKYTYSLLEGLRTRDHINIRCPEHGMFSQRIASHLEGVGCKRCAKLKSQKQILREFIAAHKDKYDYSLVRYKHGKKKVDIVCPEHGVFSQIPASHIKGVGCPFCKGRNKTLSTRLEEFRAVHKDDYDYSKVTAGLATDKVEILCREHGSFWQSPHSHMKGEGCPSCAKSGFDSKKPAILYYIKVEGLYKIGVTNLTVAQRFLARDLARMTVLMELRYKNGAECFRAEQDILKQYRDFAYEGPELLSSGNTELFTKDVLGLDK